MYSQGMWLPNELLEQETNMKSKGMTMSASDIYSINSGSLKDAIVHFGGFTLNETFTQVLNVVNTLPSGSVTVWLVVGT